MAVSWGYYLLHNIKKIIDGSIACVRLGEKWYKIRTKYNANPDWRSTKNNASFPKRFGLSTLLSEYNDVRQFLANFVTKVNRSLEVKRLVVKRTHSLPILYYNNNDTKAMTSINRCPHVF